MKRSLRSSVFGTSGRDSVASKRVERERDEGF